MKTKLLPCASVALFAVLSVSPSRGASTIDPAHPYAYAANVGWVNARANATHGASIGEYICADYLYAANVGWIHLGDGTPANGIQYANNSATDYGVNHLGDGRLRGYAYGANIGWLSFETNGNPRVDLKTGNLQGYAYSANCGWISLSNAGAFVRTGFLEPGLDSDGDGITDAWELSYTNTLAAFTASSDTDGDGSSDIAEHGADTNPLDPNDQLRIVDYAVQWGGGTETNRLQWTSKETRCYQVDYRNFLASGPDWQDATGVFAPDAGDSTSRSVLLVEPPFLQRYFRVQAFKVLPP